MKGTKFKQELFLRADKVYAAAFLQVDCLSYEVRSSGLRTAELCSAALLLRGLRTAELCSAALLLRGLRTTAFYAAAADFVV
jgi:hypothetical protein